jgi:hypothetical protein
MEGAGRFLTPSADLNVLDSWLTYTIHHFLKSQKDSYRSGETTDKGGRQVHPIDLFALSLDLSGWGKTTSFFLYIVVFTEYFLQRGEVGVSTGWRGRWWR